MEQIPWDLYKFATATRTRGDKKGEFPYYSAKSIGIGNVGQHFGPDMLKGYSYIDSNEFNKIHNKAVSKVEEQLSVISNLFEAIYERQEAYDMLYSAGKGILKFLKNWRKPKYWKSLRAGAQPKTLPEAWLAYNFGVMPLCMSIQSALDLLGSEFPTSMVRGVSGASLPIINPTSYYGEGNPWYPFQDWGGFQHVNGKANVIIQKRAYVKPNHNPNSMLLNVMGITSPLSTLYSVLPWGWAVDYFVNVSDLLGNFDNKFPGVTLDSVWETIYVTGRCDWYRYYIERWSDGTHLNQKRYKADFVTTRRQRSSLNHRLTYSFPLIGSTQIANLFSAIAVSIKK